MSSDTKSPVLQAYPCLTTQTGFDELGNLLASYNLTQNDFQLMNPTEQDLWWGDLADALKVKFGPDVCGHIYAMEKEPAQVKPKKKKKKEPQQEAKKPAQVPSTGFTMPAWGWWVGGIMAVVIVGTVTYHYAS